MNYKKITGLYKIFSYIKKKTQPPQKTGKDKKNIYNKNAFQGKTLIDIKQLGGWFDRGFLLQKQKQKRTLKKHIMRAFLFC